MAGKSNISDVPFLGSAREIGDLVPFNGPCGTRHGWYDIGK